MRNAKASWRGRLVVLTIVAMGLALGLFAKVYRPHIRPATQPAASKPGIDR